MGKRRYKSTDVSALCVLRGKVETSVDLYRYYRVFSTILSTFTCSFKTLRSFFNSISTVSGACPPNAGIFFFTFAYVNSVKILVLSA